MEHQVSVSVALIVGVTGMAGLSLADVLKQPHCPGGPLKAFNCANGDVFTWKNIWRLLSELFDVEFVPLDERQEFDWVELMRDKGEVWDQIVEKYGLHKTKLEEIACYEIVI